MTPFQKTTRCAVILLSWLALAPFSLLAQSQSLEKAEALMSAGRYGEARTLAARALQKGLSKDETVIWKWVIADSYHQEGDYEEAAGAYHELSRSESGRVSLEASLLLVRCLLHMWDGERAIEILKSLQTRNLGDLSYRRDEFEAIALFVAGKPNEALKLLKTLRRKSEAGWHYQGLITFNAGDFKKAKEYFDRAIAAAPGDYYSRLYLASSLLELHRLDDARSAFKDVQKIADTPEVNQLLGRLELRAGHFREAEAYVRKALELSPRYAEAQFGLMTALRRQKKTKEAQEAARKFEKLHRAQQEALNKAYVLSQKHQTNPKDPEPAEALALHYLANNDALAAERMAWSSLRIDPKRVQARLCLARALAMVGRFREAAVQYQRILRQDPGNPVAAGELRQLVRRHARRVDDSERAR